MFSIIITRIRDVFDTRWHAFDHVGNYCNIFSVHLKFVCWKNMTISISKLEIHNCNMFSSVLCPKNFVCPFKTFSAVFLFLWNNILKPIIVWHLPYRRLCNANDVEPSAAICNGAYSDLTIPLMCLFRILQCKSHFYE